MIMKVYELISKLQQMMMDDEVQLQIEVKHSAGDNSRARKIQDIECSITDVRGNTPVLIEADATIEVESKIIVY